MAPSLCADGIRESFPECPFGFCQERAFSLAKIPQLPLQERFKPQSACKSVAYVIWVASTVVRIDRTDTATEVRLRVRGPNLRTADRSDTIPNKLCAVSACYLRRQRPGPGGRAKRRLQTIAVNRELST